MREGTSIRFALLLAAVVAMAGCAGSAERLPECKGRSTPINVPANAGGDGGR